jgi:hypothetical protein
MVSAIQINNLVVLPRGCWNDIVAHLCFRESIGHFIRLGTQEVTRRGMDENDMELIARIVASALNNKVPKSTVQKLIAAHQDVHYSFDAILERLEGDK